MKKEGERKNLKKGRNYYYESRKRIENQNQNKTK